MEVKREPPSPIVASFPQCPECGYYHPMSPDGRCKGAQLEQQRSSKYAPLIERITVDLSSENPHTPLLAEMLEKTVRAWRIKLNQEVFKK